MNGRTDFRTDRLNWVNLALGIWVLLSPFVLGFSNNGPAQWNNVATGIAVALMAVLGASVWNIALGIWLFLSPFVLGFSQLPAPLWNNVILGALIGVIALSLSSSTRRTAAAPPASRE